MALSVTQASHRLPSRGRRTVGRLWHRDGMLAAVVLVVGTVGAGFGFLPPPGTRCGPRMPVDS